MYTTTAELQLYRPTCTLLLYWKYDWKLTIDLSISHAVILLSGFLSSRISLLRPGNLVCFQGWSALFIDSYWCSAYSVIRSCASVWLLLLFGLTSVSWSWWASPLCYRQCNRATTLGWYSQINILLMLVFAVLVLTSALRSFFLKAVGIFFDWLWHRYIWGRIWTYALCLQEFVIS